MNDKEFCPGVGVEEVSLQFIKEEKTGTHNFNKAQYDSS